MRESTPSAGVPLALFRTPSVRKLFALALLALVAGAAVYISVESEITALAGGPTVSCASHPPMATLTAHAPAAPSSCMRVASAR